MSDARSKHERLVEAAALAHVNAKSQCYGRDAMPLDWWRKQASWAHELTATRAAFAAAYSALSDVTPKMVEAAEYAWAQRIKDKARRGFVGTANPQESFKANWRAMLDASALNGGK